MLKLRHMNRNIHAMHNLNKGFTLIEMMIVVAIIGILAAIALPSYEESVKKSRRVELQRTLADAEQFMRRYYGAKDTFVGASLPTALTTSPQNATAVYNIAIATGANAATASSFTITSTRTGQMSDDRCGDLWLDQTGKRTQKNAPTGASMADCFKGS